MTVLCQCGCGQPAPIAPQTLRSKGYVKGEPMRYVHGHGSHRRGSSWTVERRGYKTPCWIWLGAKDDEGYGRASRGGRMCTAHAREYERAGREIPDGMELDHLCRVPSCVNPDHLEPVTHTENIRRGVRVKLTVERAAAIRSEVAALPRSPAGRVPDGTYARLGEKYGTTPENVRAVARGMTWVA